MSETEKIEAETAALEAETAALVAKNAKNMKNTFRLENLSYVAKLLAEAKEGAIDRVFGNKNSFLRLENLYDFEKQMAESRAEMAAIMAKTNKIQTHR